MAKPIFDTAIGGIATMIGTIPVERPQDAVKYDGHGHVVISKDGRIIRGDGCGRGMTAGDTVYIDCGSFQDASKDSRVTQCYGVIEAIISENEVLIKAPGLKWIPASLTTERDIQYIKSHKIVSDGSLMYRVERGNTLRGIEAIKAEELRKNIDILPSGTSGTFGRVMQKIFSKSPEADAIDHSRFMALESVRTSGADVPGSVPAPADFHSNESTPLLKHSQARYFGASGHPIYSAVRRGDSNTRLSMSTTRSSSVVVDVEEEVDSRHISGHGPTYGQSSTGRDMTHGGVPGSPISPTSPTAVNPLAARFPTEPCPYQYSRPIDHSLIYESVWKNFGDRRTVAIFPEGVSSDDYHLLDFKYGCTVMVLGYLAQNSSNTLRIVPCGLNFFNRHRFRSRFYADFGVPITVPDNLVTMYREGGEAKKKACTELLQIIHTAVENLTLNAPNYDELRLYKATRRLFSTGMNLNVSQKLELTRRFAKGYSKLAVTPSIAELKRDINAFDRHLLQKGVRDWQLTADPSIWTALICILPAVFLLPALFLLSVPGTLLFGPVGLLATRVAKQKGREAMLSFQSYLPVSRWPGRDLIATWKIIVCLALMPLCFIVDATLLTIWIRHWEPLQEFWTLGRLVAFWFIATLGLFPTMAYFTVWTWEWQIDLKMQINIWWWRISGGKAEMKRWRQDLVGKVNQLVDQRMGGRGVFDVSSWT
ncbi:hypothetical protein BGX34_003978 [Mortierella sp. NVP85]|nr:hypothetical protein BGX34_003978 [Mortierella sp. NVP85]